MIAILCDNYVLMNMYSICTHNHVFGITHDYENEALMHIRNFTSFRPLLIFVCLEPPIILNLMHIYVFKTVHDEDDNQPIIISLKVYVSRVFKTSVRLNHVAIL